MVNPDVVASDSRESRLTVREQGIFPGAGEIFAVRISKIRRAALAAR
jgi:hypothetical protein